MNTCSYGHNSGRGPSDNRCIECRRITNLKAKHKLFEKDPEYNKRKYLERKIAGHNFNTEAARKAKKLWSRNNQSKRNAQEAKRRASKLQATPIWADLKSIQIIYDNCPVGFQVDHIEPLQGKTICGLHVAWNLQYLSAKDNQSKGNRT